MGDAEKLPTLITEYSENSFLLNSKMIVILFNQFTRRSILSVNHIETLRASFFKRNTMFPIHRHELLPCQFFNVSQPTNKSLSLFSWENIERIFFIQRTITYRK